MEYIDGYTTDNYSLIEENTLDLYTSQLIETIDNIVNKNVCTILEEKKEEESELSDIEKKYKQLLIERNLYKEKGEIIHATIEEDLEKKVINIIGSIEAPSMDVIEKYKCDFIQIEKEYRSISKKLHAYKKEEQGLRQKADTYIKALSSFQDNNLLSKSNSIFESVLLKTKEEINKGIVAKMDEIKGEIIPLIVSYNILGKKRNEFLDILKSLQTYMNEIESINDKNHVHGTCTICMENECNAAIVPCGHVFCKSCCDMGNMNRCPTCRTNCEKYIQLYF
jgi:hypothetical protein